MKWPIFLATIVPVAVAYVKGVNFYGLETTLGNVDCSWDHPAEWYLSKANGVGFNGIRLPFSAEYVQAGNFQVMDKIFETCDYYNMSILLDYHRTFNSHQGNWYETTMDKFVQTWSLVIDRYGNRSAVSGIGLYNEFQNNDAPFWVRTMREAINQLELKYSALNLTYVVGGTQWGASLVGIDLEDMGLGDRLKYEIHKYIFTGTSNPSDWDYSFGTYTNKTIVGEYGYISSKPEQVAWARQFINYLDSRNIRDTYFWVLTPNSDQTQGLFKTCAGDMDWQKLETINQLYWWRRLRSQNTATLQNGPQDL